MRGWTLARNMPSSFTKACAKLDGQMKRDLANKIVTVPDSIPQLIVIVMQRKEAPVKADTARKVAFVTNDSAASAQQPNGHPIIWYGKDEQTPVLSKDEYHRRIIANKLVFQAFSNIISSNGPGASKCGWTRVVPKTSPRNEETREKQL